MTEADARIWLEAHVPRGALAQLEDLVEIVRASSTKQNLIAATTLDSLWARHVVDSMQLLALAPTLCQWLDIGTGAGFPGLAIACARPAEMVLVEPRRLRANFLADAAEALGLRNVEVIANKIERVADIEPAIISARAVAPLDRLFASAHHLAGKDTIWLLPKGAKAHEELAAAKRSWQGDFRLVPSITDAAASIVVAQHVRRRG